MIDSIDNIVLTSKNVPKTINFYCIILGMKLEENHDEHKGKKRFYSIVGYICETDTFGNNRKISEISEDDYLLFKNSGAYCFNMSSNYNSRYRPAEVLIIEDKSYLIRKRETFKDLLRNQIKIEFPDKNNS